MTTTTGGGWPCSECGRIGPTMIHVNGRPTCDFCLTEHYKPARLSLYFEPPKPGPCHACAAMQAKLDEHDDARIRAEERTIALERELRTANIKTAERWAVEEIDRLNGLLEAAERELVLARAIKR